MRAAAWFIPGGRGSCRTNTKLGRSLALPLVPWQVVFRLPLAFWLPHRDVAAGSQLYIVRLLFSGRFKTKHSPYIDLRLFGQIRCKSNLASNFLSKFTRLGADDQR
jgi:hypothetical protein